MKPEDIRLIFFQVFFNFIAISIILLWIIEALLVAGGYHSITIVYGSSGILAWVYVVWVLSFAGYWGYRAIKKYYFKK